MQERMSRNRWGKKRYFTFIATAVTCGALYLAFRHTDITAIYDYIRQGQYLYVIPAFGGLMLYSYLRAVRWGHFFQMRPNPGLLFSATMIGLMANNIFPARAGEFLKAYLLGKHAGISKSGCLATVVLERVWDGLTLLLFIGVLCATVLWNGPSALGNGSGGPLIRYAVYISAAVYLLILITVLTWKFHHVKATAWLTGFVAKASPRSAGYLEERLLAFTGGFSIFHDPRRIVIVSAYSVLIWLSAVATLFLMFKVFAFDLPAAASFILVILIGMFVMIPSVGSLGTMQLAFVFGLAMYGIEKNQALSFSLVYQFFDTVPIVIIGLIFFFKDGLSLRRLSAMKEEMK